MRRFLPHIIIISLPALLYLAVTLPIFVTIPWAVTIGALIVFLIGFLRRYLPLAVIVSLSIIVPNAAMLMLISGSVSTVADIPMYIILYHAQSAPIPLLMALAVGIFARNYRDLLMGICLCLLLATLYAFLVVKFTSPIRTDLFFVPILIWPVAAAAHIGNLLRAFAMTRLNSRH